MGVCVPGSARGQTGNCTTGGDRPARTVTRLCLVFTLNSCTDLFSSYGV